MSFEFPHAGSQVVQLGVWDAIRDFLLRGRELLLGLLFDGLSDRARLQLLRHLNLCRLRVVVRRSRWERGGEAGYWRLVEIRIAYVLWRWRGLHVGSSWIVCAQRYHTAATLIG